MKLFLRGKNLLYFLNRFRFSKVCGTQAVMKKIFQLLACFLISFSALAQPLGPHVDQETDKAIAWIRERQTNAPYGKKEIIRVPLVRRSLGWGCDCPEFYIGRMITGNILDQWLTVTYAKGIKPLQNGDVVTAEGYFTGKKIEKVYEEDSRYVLWEFFVTKVTPRLPVADELSDHPEDHLMIVTNF